MVLLGVKGLKHCGFTNFWITSSWSLSGPVAFVHSQAIFWLLKTRGRLFMEWHAFCQVNTSNSIGVLFCQRCKFPPQLINVIINVTSEKWLDWFFCFRRFLKLYILRFLMLWQFLNFLNYPVVVLKVSASAIAMLKWCIANICCEW